MGFILSQNKAFPLFFLFNILFTVPQEQSWISLQLTRLQPERMNIFWCGCFCDTSFKNEQCLLWVSTNGDAYLGSEKLKTAFPHTFPCILQIFFPRLFSIKLRVYLVVFNEEKSKINKYWQNDEPFLRKSHIKTQKSKIANWAENQF